MRIEESDVVIYEVDLWKFVKEIEDNMSKGFKIKSYELSAFCPSHNGIAYHVVMEKDATSELLSSEVNKERLLASMEQIKNGEAVERELEKPTRRAPPVRQSKKQAE